ncbi:axonemal dynein light intermediate polypeptide 1-like, partial [Takifugu flavidus]
SATIQPRFIFQVSLAPSPPHSKDKSGYKKDSSLHIVDSIFPPRYWAEGNDIWMQQVSSTPSTKADVIQLKESLDTKLQQRGAGQLGICPIRSELYSQCFNELIRQMAVNCAERGLLLFRIGEEIQTTVATYKTLYESSIAFGIRKRLLEEQGNTDMQKRISDLEKEKEELKMQLSEQRAKNVASEKKETERQQQEEKKQSDEIQALQRTKRQLMDQLLEIITPKK